VRLLDIPRLLGQFQGLQRALGRSGKDAVEHQRGSHDDLSNAAAGSLVYAIRNVGVLPTLPPDFVRCLRKGSIELRSDDLLSIWAAAVDISRQHRSADLRQLHRPPVREGRTSSVL
jgi:hypothetical protein